MRVDNHGAEVISQLTAVETERKRIHQALQRQGRRLDRGTDGEAWHIAGDLQVIWSVSMEADGQYWLHVSARAKKRIPTYQELTRIKTLFIGDDRIAYHIFAPANEHVNIHPYVLHLWAPLQHRVTPDFTQGTGSI